MSQGKKPDTCSLCGRRAARTRRMSRSYGAGKSLVVIEGVPVVSCANCGAAYMAASTLRTLESLKRRPRVLMTRRQVGVLRFAQQA